MQRCVGVCVSWGQWNVTDLRSISAKSFKKTLRGGPRWHWGVTSAVPPSGLSAVAPPARLPLYTFSRKCIETVLNEPVKSLKVRIA